MSEKRGFIQFLIAILAPFALILIGAGIGALGLSLEWQWLVWMGLIVAGAGVVWGLVLLFFALA